MYRSLDDKPLIKAKIVDLREGGSRFEKLYVPLKKILATPLSLSAICREMSSRRF